MRSRSTSSRLRVRAVAGLPFAWTITVTNEGPSDSVATAETPIEISDLLPAGVKLSTELASGGDGVTCLVADSDAERELVVCERQTFRPPVRTSRSLPCSGRCCC